MEKSNYNKLNQAKGYRGKEGGFFLNHSKSPVRIKASSAVQFIVKVNPGTNPTSIIDLVAFEIREDQRVLITNRLSGSGTESYTSLDKMSYQVKKVAEGVYLLTATGLKAGEYLLGTHDNMFAFGIDN